jgi:hypothetical protein
MAQPSKREIVLDHLRVKHPIPKEAVKEEIAPGKALALVEQDWVRVIKNLRKRLEEQGLDASDEALKGKQQVFQAWKYEFELLVELSQAPGMELRRYDEGPEGSVGFLVLQNDQQRYWLHWKFNRERDDY